MAFYTTGEWVRFCEEGEEEPCPRSVDCDYCHA
jgi:hypothetical protein